MLTVNAYTATSATEPLAPATIDRRDVGPHDVLIEVKYCGICHSDIHYVRGEWDAENVKVTNVSEANRFVRRQYRKGWEVEGL